MEETPQEIILNADQENGAEQCLAFLLSDDKEFHLKGPAGVGKTFMMKWINSTILADYRQACQLYDIPEIIKEVAFTATTNKAAEVLGDSLGLPAQTIHSYLRLRVYNDHNDGSTRLEKTRNYIVRSNVLLFVDEASMVDMNLLKIIRESFLNSKIIWVGDEYQLAPVREEVPSVYQNQSLVADLKTPMRNSGQPALMDLCEQFRETVRTGVFKPIQEVPGVIEYLDDSTMPQKMIDYFADKEHNSRILANTNSKVNTFNKHVRFIRNLPDHFTEGEHLVSAQAYRFGDNSLSVEQEVTVMNVEPDKLTEQVFDDGGSFFTYPMGIKTRLGSMTVRVPNDPVHFMELMKYYRRAKKWSNYFKMKETFPDLRPSEASTIYKAQGSTYDTNFIDLADVSTCNHRMQVARMLYVGVSRPRNKLYLYNRLKPAYGG